MLHSWQVSCVNTSMLSLLAANKIKLWIVVKNFTSYPKQTKNTEASKSDKKENSFIAGACAKINPCKLVTLFPNSHSSWTATFFTSSILTFLGLKDVRAEECQIQTPPGKHEPIAIYCTNKHKKSQKTTTAGQVFTIYFTILYLIVMIALKLRMQ